MSSASLARTNVTPARLIHAPPLLTNPRVHFLFIEMALSFAFFSSVRPFLFLSSALQLFHVILADGLLGLVCGWIGGLAGEWVVTVCQICMFNKKGIVGGGDERPNPEMRDWFPKAV